MTRRRSTPCKSCQTSNRRRTRLNGLNGVRQTMTRRRILREAAPTPTHHCDRLTVQRRRMPQWIDRKCIERTRLESPNATRHAKCASARHRASTQRPRHSWARLWREDVDHSAGGRHGSERQTNGHRCLPWFALACQRTFEGRSGLPRFDPRGLQRRTCCLDCCCCCLDCFSCFRRSFNVFSHCFFFSFRFALVCPCLCTLAAKPAAPSLGGGGGGGGGGGRSAGRDGCNDGVRCDRRLVRVLVGEGRVAEGAAARIEARFRGTIPSPAWSRCCRPCPGPGRPVG